MTMCESICTIGLTMTNDLNENPVVTASTASVLYKHVTIGAIDMHNVTQTATCVGLAISYKLATTSSTP